jgi:hypothetical protein
MLFNFRVYNLIISMTREEKLVTKVFVKPQLRMGETINSRTDKELLKMISQLNDYQKKSIVDLIKSFYTRQTFERQSIEEYNFEIDQAIKNVKHDNYTTYKNLKKEMKNW